MADYILGLLSFKENIKIKWHLFRCSNCMKNYQKARLLLIEKCDDTIEQPVSKNMALSFVKNLSTSKLDFKIRSFNWIKDACAPETIRSKPVFRTSSEDEINYYQIDRYFDEIETKIYFEKIDDHQFYMDVKATLQDNSTNHIDLILEKTEGGGHIKRPFKNGMASIDSIPFDSYRMIIVQNEIFKGDYYFTINQDGHHE